MFSWDGNREVESGFSETRNMAMMDTETLSIAIRVVPGTNTAFLEVAGALDAYTFDQLEAAIDALIRERYFRMVIDLSGLEYISSAGVGVFFSATAEVREHGGELVLVKIHPQVSAVFDLLGVAQFFRTEISCDEVPRELEAG